MNISATLAELNEIPGDLHLLFASVDIPELSRGIRHALLAAILY